MSHWRPYLEGYEYPAWPANFAKRATDRGFIAVVPNFGAPPMIIRVSGKEYTIVQSSGDLSKRAVEDACAILGLAVAGYADGVAYFVLDGDGSPGHPDILSIASEILFMPADHERVVGATLKGLRWIYAYTCSSTAEAYQKSCENALAGFLKNATEKPLSFTGRFHGFSIFSIVPCPQVGPQRCDIVIAGPTPDSSENWLPLGSEGALPAKPNRGALDPYAGPFEPWHGIIWELTGSGFLDAIEIVAGLPPRRATMGRTKGRYRTLKIYVHERDLDDWINALIGWAARNWLEKRLAPGHVRYLKPMEWILADRKRGDR